MVGWKSHSVPLGVEKLHAVAKIREPSDAEDDFVAMVAIYHLNLPDLNVPPTPDWLRRHGGELRPAVQPDVVEIWVDGQPLYRLEVRPARDQYECAVVDMTNGRRLDNPRSVYATPEQALHGGLEQLRSYLGW